MKKILFILLLIVIAVALLKVTGTIANQKHSKLFADEQLMAEEMIEAISSEDSDKVRELLTSGKPLSEEELNRLRAITDKLFDPIDIKSAQLYSETATTTRGNLYCGEFKYTRNDKSFTGPISFEISPTADGSQYPRKYSSLALGPEADAACVTFMISKNPDLKQ